MEIKLPCENRKKRFVITNTFNQIKGERKTVFMGMLKSVHIQMYSNIEHLIVAGVSPKMAIINLILRIN